MAVPATARMTMRAETAADHERVDAAFAGFDLGERTGYAAFLTAQAKALLPVERAIDRAAPGAVLPDWPDRRRSALLLADLAALGIAADTSAAAPSFDSVEAMLGAVYVLEGSRLGGRMLVRRVPPELPRRFLDADDAGRWRTLTDLLDRRLVSPADQAAALAGARTVFALFEAGARAGSGR